MTREVDDGKPELTVRVKSGDYYGEFVVNEKNKEQVIYDGWMKFVQMPSEAFDIKPPSGNDIRRLLREPEDDENGAG